MDKLLKVATTAGKYLLMSGAETYRVEETIVRICQAYHVDDADAFVLPTGMFVSVIKDGKTYSSNIRVQKRSTNINVIDEINKIARYIQTNPMTLEELEKAINDVVNGPKYSQLIINLLAGIGAFGFAFFFGGDLKDAICSFVIGFIVKAIVDFLDKLEVTAFIYNMIGGAFISISAYLCMVLSVGSNMDTIIIASIMLLVPGLAMTNAIRDSLAGDLVSGMARGIEAILIATSIALGAAAAVRFIEMLGGVI